MLLDILQNFLVNTVSLIFVMEKRNIIATHDKKFIHVVFEIRGTETSNLSLKLIKNIPAKTIKISNSESFHLGPGLLIFSFWYFNFLMLVPCQRCILLAPGSKRKYCNQCIRILKNSIKMYHIFLIFLTFLMKVFYFLILAQN